jgi:hypothetical protein
MKKLFLFLLLLILTSSSIFAQTTLSAGDIAIVGFNSVDPDEFAFVCLVDLQPGTIIRFTDAGWTSGNTFWNGGEGAVTFTAGTNYNVGEVIFYSGTGPEWTSYSVYPFTGSFSLAESRGDQILAFQGTALSPEPFVYAINFSGTGWLQVGPFGEDDSELPTDLANGFTAVDFGKVKNGYYAAGPYSDLNALRLAIGSADNWITSNSRYDLQAIFTDPLPMELTSFSAVIKDKTVDLNWVTETEVNSYGFEVQRSGVSDKWEVLGFVEGHGNSNSPKNYSFTDSEVISSGEYSYRLKMIDNDGSYEYSKIIEISFGVPLKIALNQNYPNPFNPSTTISFTLPESGNVSLKIYNTLGENVSTLLNEYKEAGVYSYNFNAENLPSGTYIYRLNTDTKTLTKKMLFLK